MQSDLPHTLFNRGKGNAREETKSKTIASDEVIRLQEEANRRSEERRKAELTKDSDFTLDELFEK